MEKIHGFLGKLKSPWIVFGFVAQFIFMMRFIIQWLASEKRGRSHVPVVFWYFSLLGGLMLMVYAIKQADPVFTFGQGLGCFIYIRNLTMIYKRQLAYRKHKKFRAERKATLMDTLMGDGLAENGTNGNGSGPAADTQPVPGSTGRPETTPTRQSA